MASIFDAWHSLFRTRVQSEVKLFVVRATKPSVWLIRQFDSGIDLIKNFFKPSFACRINGLQ